jgi:hypothetical protein
MVQKNKFLGIGNLDAIIKSSLDLDIANLVLQQGEKYGEIKQQIFITGDSNLILEVEICKEE